jgi:hypothetical protein
MLPIQRAQDKRLLNRIGMRELIRGRISNRLHIAHLNREFYAF